MKHTVQINKRTGMIEWLSPPPFRVPITTQKRQRFSTIEPLDPLLRLLFKALRFCFGEQGKVSDWTRAWRVTWIAKVLIGRNRGAEFISPFRQACLDWEKEKFSEPRFPL